jgi:hypothetical protein
MDRQPEYIVDARTGRTLRIVRRVSTGASQQPLALPPPQSRDEYRDRPRYVRPPGSGQQIIVVRHAETSRAAAVPAPKRKAGVLASGITLVICIGALWLIPGMIIPRSPVGMMSVAWGSTIRAAGSGVGEFAMGMITEPDNAAPSSSTPVADDRGATSPPIRWSGSSRRLRVDIKDLGGAAGSWTIHGIVTNIGTDTIDVGLSSFIPSGDNGETYDATDNTAVRTLGAGEGVEIELKVHDPSTDPRLTLTVVMPPDPEIVLRLWDDPSRGKGEPPINHAAVADADLSLVGPPSITATKIDGILAGYGSPSAGTGEAWIAAGMKYKIDPAFAVAFFIHESSAGTNPVWAGLKPDGSTTYNVGNIICAGYATCYGRFRDYSGWDVGIEDWFRLIRVEYIDGRGTDTLLKIIMDYAPATENDVDAYVSSVAGLVRGWWAEAPAAQTAGGSAGAAPSGNPLGDGANIVMTQGYGVGSHAPAESWGAIDLAVDGDGDGYANPDATTGHPVYATMAGRVTVTPDSYPAGNHIWVTGDQYRAGYSHLLDFVAEDGAMVSRGDLIGHVGSTGMSSGPHLDYQIWEMQDGQWVNRNPLDFGSGNA